MMNAQHAKHLVERLPRKIVALLHQLGRLADKDGIALFLVGGVVRDLLLERKNWDVDLTVEGDGIAFARSLAGRYDAGLVIFQRFATARLVFPDGRKIDIASTRRESYSNPAALPDVQPASLKEDLHRRDFTINAMAIQLNAAHFGRLHDPYGGQRDLKAKTLRILHEGSFVDDPTRIFRAIRFARRFNFRIERTTLRLLRRAAGADLVGRLSGPRLSNEILLLLGECDPAKSIDCLARLKLLRFLHPRLRIEKRSRQVVRAIPSALSWWAKRGSSYPIDRPVLYLMAVLSDAPHAVLRGVSRRLQLSSAQSRSVAWAGAKTSRAAKVLSEKEERLPSRVYRLLAKIPDEALALLIAKGVVMGTARAGRYLRSRLSRFLMRDRRAAISTTGEDLKELGLKPGPRFRNILDRLLDARIDGTVTTDSEERILARRLAES